MTHTQNKSAQTVATALIALFLIIASASYPTQASSKLSPAQQANADAALLGLWWSASGPHDGHDGENVSAARVKAALDSGANVEARLGVDGYTSLMLAAYHGNLECVRLLVAKRANVNARSTGGWTALINAVMSRNLGCVKFLVSHGADVNATANSADMSVLREAIMCGRIECVEYLVSKGADVNAKNRHGWTPLMVSALLGHVDCVKVFISNGADVNAKADSGETALSLALGRNHPDIVAILKAAGAK